MAIQEPTTGTRTCRKCRLSFPFAELVFMRGKPQTMCRTCNAAKTREWYAKNKNSSRPVVEYPDLDLLRKCRTCSEEKPLREFAVSKGRRFFRCQSCNSRKSRGWSAANREKSRASKAAYCERHPERNTEAKRRYAKSQRHHAVSRAYKDANRDRLNAEIRKQFSEDPAPFHKRQRRRRERARAVGGLFAAEDKQAMFVQQEGLCANPRCRKDISDGKFNADHILALIHGGTHWPENRQLLCIRCNHLKATKKPEEWQAMIDNWEEASAVNFARTA